MTTVEILRAARAKIEDPARWTQNRMARDDRGVPVPFVSAEAVCWCAEGAVHVVAPNVKAACFALKALGRVIRAPRAVVSFNDTHSHAEVLALFDEAIAHVEAEA